MLNDPSKIAGVVKPNAQIKINNKQCSWTSLDIESTNSYRADTFRIVFPTQDQPNFIFDELIDTEQLNVEINLDDGRGLKRFLVGDVDYIEVDPFTKIAVITGRDYVARFLDNTTTERYPSYTSAQIIFALAVKHKLKTRVTETTVPVGSYYMEEYSKLTTNTSEWDLMMSLAQREDFDLYVDGDTLVFAPKPTTKNYYIVENKDVSSGVSASNVTRIKFHRNYTIANDISVVVHGFDLLTQKTYRQSVSRRHVPNRGQKRQKYIASVPGITQEQASQMAQSVALQLSLHEKTFRATLAGDNILTPRDIIKVTGYGSRWDQLYYPVTVARHVSFGGDYNMIVDAKNHDPNTQVDIT